MLCRGSPNSPSPQSLHALELGSARLPFPGWCLALAHGRKTKDGEVTKSEDKSRESNKREKAESWRRRQWTGMWKSRWGAAMGLL